MDLISIIVPVYNVQDYLEACLQSITEQTYANIEVILVNDGSQDDSESICQRYCQKDNRFRLITQKNQGLGPARNCGLSNAHGAYVCFVDADDRIHRDYIMHLYQNAKEYQADVSVCAFIKFEHASTIKIDKNQQREAATFLITRMEMIQKLCTTGPNSESEKVVPVWNKLYRREIFDNLFFEQKFHEDEYIISDILLRANQFVYTEEILYFYRQRKNSIMSTSDTETLHRLEGLPAYERRLELFHGEEYQDIFEELVTAYLENCTITYLLSLKKGNMFSLKKQIFPGMLRWITKQKKHRYWLFLCSPKLYQKRYWS